ncbi:hypothetical protein I3760_13G146700 [Carya illinoinensis]|nr:hypothetical protein I3760_13G146700 [Carya illinoinensis]
MIEQWVSRPQRVCVLMVEYWMEVDLGFFLSKKARKMEEKRCNIVKNWEIMTGTGNKAKNTKNTWVTAGEGSALVIWRLQVPAMVDLGERVPLLVGVYEVDGRILS